MDIEYFFIWYDRDEDSQWCNGDPWFCDGEWDKRSDAPTETYYACFEGKWQRCDLEMSPFAAPLSTRYCYRAVEISTDQVPEEFKLIKLLAGE